MIIVDEATILAADDTDTNGLVVAFILYDVVDNASTWSAGVRVVVDTGSSRLIGPLIKEAVNMVLDMDRLGEADLTFQVFTFGGEFAVGDQIEMRLSGLTASGERVDKTYPPEVITNAAGITEFTRPSTEVRALAGGIHATFFYRLIKADGSDDLFSKTFSPKVIGRSTILAAPIAYDEIAGTLDPDLPNTRVDIPWDDGMAQGNVIMLVWEGTTANGIPYAPDLPLHPITDNEVGKTIPISVDGVHLKAIEDGTLELYYWLLDNEINRAAIRHESLHAGPFRIGPFVAELPAPVVQYESGGVLDPDDVPLTGTQLTVLQYTGQIEKDVVHILWWGSITGRYRDQITLNSVTDKIDVPFTIPKALVEGNRGGTVQALYWVKRANGHVSPSAILLMSIGAAMDLLAPSVKEATGTAPTQQLNPVAASTALTVVIPNYGLQPGDEVRVTWAGTAGEGSYVTPVQELPPNREIDIPMEVIAYNLGEPVTVSYTVTRNGDESLPSDLLTLTVLDMPADALEPSKPRILEAANNGAGPELNVSNLTGDATVRIDSWPLIAQGQRIWLRLVGTKDDGSGYEKLWGGASNWVSAEWYRQGYGEKIVPESELRALRDGSTLTLEFKASFNQSLDEDQATLFPLRTYTVNAIALEAPNISDIRDSKRSIVDKITADTSVTVTGTGSSGQDIQLRDGSDDIGPVITIPATGTTWDATLTGLTVRAYSLKARALYGTGIPDSQAKAFIVTTASIPTLDNVKDDKGAEINEGDFTTSLLIDVNGTASRDQEVEIYDGNGATAELKGTTKADPVTGRWSLPDIAVTPKVHRFYAKALYNTGGTVYSNVRNFTVIDILNLPPSVKEATGTAPTQQLNPMAATTELTVVIPNYGIQPGDQVRVTWTGTAGAGSHTTQVQALPDSREITLPVSVIAYNLGKPVTVTYRVTHNGKESDPSALLNLTVQSFTENDLLGSKPKLLQAANNGEGSELDLNTLNADAKCRLTIWPHLASGQDIWLRLKGTKADGTVPYDLTIWNPPPRGPATSQSWLDAGFYDTTVPYSYLKDLKDGSTLTIEFKADLSQTTNEANATTFPLRTYTVRAIALVAPTLDDITDSKGSVVGGTTFESSVTVTGTGSSGQQIQLRDGDSNIGSVITIPTSGTTWDAPLTGLNPKAYSLKARPLYGTGLPDSDAKTFTVATAVVPEILSVVGRPSNTEIPDNSSTMDTQVFLIGKSIGSESIQLFDGTTPIGIYTATGGNWNTSDLIPVGQGRHSFTAQALYGNNPVSLPRTFTVSGGASPTLIDISDSKGSVVGKFTVENSVTVTGTGSSGGEIQLLDNTTNIGSPFRVPDNSTTWSTPLNNLTSKAYNIKAKALYGNGLPESAVKTFNVTAMVRPSITNVGTASGAEVPDGGVTDQVNVTLFGKASINQRVEIFDGTTLKDTVGTNGSGDWSLHQNGLEQRLHSFTAKALYDSNPVSDPRTFTVQTATLPPYITAVRDPATSSLIPDGGYTSATTVDVIGRAPSNERLQVYDNTTYRADVGVDGNGNWNLLVGALTSGPHLFKARALYGNNPESNIWGINVEEPEVGPKLTFPYFRAKGITNSLDYRADTTNNKLPAPFFNIIVGSYYNAEVMVEVHRALVAGESYNIDFNVTPVGSARISVVGPLSPGQYWRIVGPGTNFKYMNTTHIIAADPNGNWPRTTWGVVT
ncbi:hypothetical protein [Pseudomonas gingeri]|nr:hypothetical protein [Pseudomonas gingeri]